MPRDISGNYTLPSGINPVVSGTLIDVDWANPTLDDVALQLNNVVTRDGLLGPLAPIGFPAGTQLLPSITFAADTDTGIYNGFANNLNFTAGGTLGLLLSATGVRAYLPLRLPDGTVADPAVTVGASSGFYLEGASDIGVSVGDTIRAAFNSGGLDLLAGSAASPSLSFLTDTNSGMFSGGADIVDFTTGGVGKGGFGATPGFYVGDRDTDAGSSGVGLYVRPRLVSALVTQYGALVNTMFSSAATTAVYAGYINPRFESGAYTSNSVGLMRLANPTLGGGGHAITTLRGLHVEDLTSGTNNQGIYLGVTAGANKYAIYSPGDAESYFAGNLEAANVLSGTHTPVVSSTTNVSASTPGVAQWMRVGDVVTMSGPIDIDPTLASTLTILHLTLPFASDFTSTAQCAGVIANNGVNAIRQAGIIYCNTTNNLARIEFTTAAADTANQGWTYTLTYLIV